MFSSHVTITRFRIAISSGPSWLDIMNIFQEMEYYIWRTKRMRRRKATRLQSRPRQRSNCCASLWRAARPRALSLGSLARSNTYHDHLLEVKLPYKFLCSSVGWSVWHNFKYHFPCYYRCTCLIWILECCCPENAIDLKSKPLNMKGLETNTNFSLIWWTNLKNSLPKNPSSNLSI